MLNPAAELADIAFEHEKQSKAGNSLNWNNL